MARGRKAIVGDTRTAPNGYHYTREKDGWKLTHRIVIEEHMGRAIGDDERVRFIDGDRTNITAENLEVYTIKQASDEAKIARLEIKKEEIIEELISLYKRVGDDRQAELLRRALI